MATTAQIWLQVRPESHFQRAFEYDGTIFAPATRVSQTEALVHPENAYVSLGHWLPRGVENALILQQEDAGQQVTVQPSYSGADVQYLLSFYPVFIQNNMAFITPE